MPTAPCLGGGCTVRRRLTGENVARCFGAKLVMDGAVSRLNVSHAPNRVGAPPKQIFEVLGIHSSFGTKEVRRCLHLQLPKINLFSTL